MARIHDYFRQLKQIGASDLHFAANRPPMYRASGQITPVPGQPVLNDASLREMLREVVSPLQWERFEREHDLDFATELDGVARFRGNFFVQHNGVGAVFRIVPDEIIPLDNLGVPDSVHRLAELEAGMVLVTGPTGSGKSTTLATMVDTINRQLNGHIITIEDPVEFVHQHQNCLITQREVGVDTASWDNALVNTLRQAPDVILIGEIRDRDTMEYGIQFAETGHLVLATLHANSSNQALDRIINFFPEEKRDQLLMDLSLNVKGIIAQRLLPRSTGQGRIAAMEIMLASPLISDLIFKGEVHQLKEVMARSNRLGMKTFDQALFDLFDDGNISYEDALRNADSRNELRLRIKLESKRADKAHLVESGALKIVEEEE